MRAKDRRNESIQKGRKHIGINNCRGCFSGKLILTTPNFTAYSYKILGTYNLTIHFVVMKIARAIMYKIRGIKKERGFTAEKIKGLSNFFNKLLYQTRQFNEKSFSFGHINDYGTWKFISSLKKIHPFLYYFQSALNSKESPK